MSRSSWPRIVIWGSLFLLFLVLNVPVMLTRSWRALHDPSGYGEPWPYWLASAVVNGAVGVGGLYWVWSW